MRILIAALAAAGALTAAAPIAHAETLYIDHTEWAAWGDLKSLRVYPSATGRAEAATLGTQIQQDRAWAEVLTLAPEADIPGMQAQFNCHWQFAEFVEPGKTSWNLEPWRPVVSDAELVAAGCNPGGTEEPF